MYLVFYSTSNVFKAEEILETSNIECKIVPTPVKDKAYCGVCVQTDSLEATKLCNEMEHEVIEE